jgi:hypothetical protein
MAKNRNLKKFETSRELFCILAWEIIKNDCRFAVFNNSLVRKMVSLLIDTTMRSRNALLGQSLPVLSTRMRSSMDTFKRRLSDKVGSSSFTHNMHTVRMHAHTPTHTHTHTPHTPHTHAHVRKHTRACIFVHIIITHYRRARTKRLHTKPTT